MQDIYSILEQFSVTAPKWGLRYGKSPYLNCSTTGFRPLSAFVAKVDGKSIETQYQACKKFGSVSGLNWREAKGRTPDNQAECETLYHALWREYIQKNPALINLLVSASGLFDPFARKGINQALVLWEIRNRFIGMS